MATQNPIWDGMASRTAGGLRWETPAIMQTPLLLHVQVAGVDATVARAVEAGAKLERPIANQEYGFRSGGIRDPFGHRWYFSGPIRT
jgi:PhnB protein